MLFTPSLRLILCLSALAPPLLAAPTLRDLSDLKIEPRGNTKSTSKSKPKKASGNTLVTSVPPATTAITASSAISSPAAAASPPPLILPSSDNPSAAGFDVNSGDAHVPTVSAPASGHS